MVVNSLSFTRSPLRHERVQALSSLEHCHHQLPFICGDDIIKLKKTPKYIILYIRIVFYAYLGFLVDPDF